MVEASEVEVKRLSLLEGAKKAAGTAVIIDVLRAFTTGAFIMANGAREIRLVGTVEEALELRRENPDWLVSGEVHGRKVPGFDYGNSPFEVSCVDFTGRTVVQRTSSGVQGVLAASHAKDILLGSFVTASSTIDYIRRRKPELISLVAMGWEGETVAVEDELCAEYLERLILGKKPDFASMRQRIMDSPSAARFLGRDQSDFKEEDLEEALSLNKIGFALHVRRGTPLVVEKA